MTIATQNTNQKGTQNRMTLEEYLTYDDGTDVCYELVDGVLVAMGAESTINSQITMLLVFAFARLGLPSYRVGMKQKIQIRSHYASARDPDLIIHTNESESAIAGRSEACLFLNEPNPLLVIEIVSPGSESSDNYKRDYEQKPLEYAARGISEYWIVDPERAWVKVGTLLNGEYQFADFTGNCPILSPTFPALNLTVAAVLTAGRVPSPDRLK
jgi:Uma2 family endonuclease